MTVGKSRRTRATQGEILHRDPSSRLEYNGDDDAQEGDTASPSRPGGTAHPQVEAVGLTEEQPRDKGLDARVLSLPVNAVAGTAVLGLGISGTVQLVLADRTIVGATMTGPGVGEMIHAATIAVTNRLTLEQLWHAILAFPTMSEIWLRLLEADRFS